MIRTRTLALAATAALTLACAQQPRGEDPSPAPNAGGAPPPAQAQRPAAEEPAEAPARAPRERDALRVQILAPREGATLGEAPVEVVVEVTHRGELRALGLEGGPKGLRAEPLARQELEAGQPGGGNAGEQGLGGGGGAVTEGDVSFSHITPGGSDADKTIARAKVATKVIERILGEWSFSALRGERRREVVTQAIATLRKERFQARGDKWRYTAVVNLPEARALVLDAFAVERTFGKDPYLLVAEGDSWWKGANLGRDEVEAIRGGLTTASADWLNRWRFRQAASERLSAGAILQRGPVQQSTLNGLGQTYGAGLVVCLKGGISFEAFQGSNHATAAGFRGYLRTRGLTCQVYDRARDEIVASFALKSDPDKRSEEEATTDSVHQPWIAQDASLGAEAESYALFLGRVVASNIMRRLCSDYYAQIPLGPTRGVTCPGCGDLCSPDLAVCPACESPLKDGAASPTPVAGPALYRSRYRFLIPQPQVGVNTIRVVATDASGKTASDRSSFSYSPPDREPPVIKVVRPRDGVTVGESPVEMVLEVSDERSLKEVLVSGRPLRGAAGKQRFAQVVNLEASDGVNRVRIEASDAAGNRAEQVWTFTYRAPDRLPPSLEILSPKAGALLSSPQVEVRLRASDDRGLREVLVGETAATQRGEEWVATVTLREGEQTLTAIARDAAGNGTRKEVRVRFERPDTVAPVLTLLAPKAKSSLTNAPVIVVVDAKDERGVTRVEINGAQAQRDAQGRWRVQITSPREGANALQISARDAAGNEATLNATFHFDSTPPEVEANAGLTVKGVMKDLSATLTINGVKVDYDKTTGAYEARVPPHPDHPGKIVIVAVDEFGNKSERVENVR